MEADLSKIEDSKSKWKFIQYQSGEANYGSEQEQRRMQSMDFTFHLQLLTPTKTSIKQERGEDTDDVVIAADYSNRISWKIDIGLMKFNLIITDQGVVQLEGDTATDCGKSSRGSQQDREEFEQCETYIGELLLVRGDVVSITLDLDVQDMTAQLLVNNYPCSSAPLRIDGDPILKYHPSRRGPLHYSPKWTGDPSGFTQSDRVFAFGLVSVKKIMPRPYALNSGDLDWQFQWKFTSRFHF